MGSQVFKKQVPNELLFTLLENICMKNNNCYVFNTTTFRKGTFNELISNFLNELKPYYHLTKQKYIDRKLTYNSFTTILRQICKFNKIVYTSKIQYDKSVYEIVYYVYF